MPCQQLISRQEWMYNFDWDIWSAAPLQGVTMITWVLDTAWLHHVPLLSTHVRTYTRKSWRCNMSVMRNALLKLHPNYCDQDVDVILRIYAIGCQIQKLHSALRDSQVSGFRPIELSFCCSAIETWPCRISSEDLHVAACFEKWKMGRWLRSGIQATTLLGSLIDDSG